MDNILNTPPLDLIKFNRSVSEQPVINNSTAPTALHCFNAQVKTSHTDESHYFIVLPRVAFIYLFDIDNTKNKTFCTHTNLFSLLITSM